MVTLFEQKLGYELPNVKLRTAIKTHKSVIPPRYAMLKYGYSQQSLAYYGDRLLHDAVTLIKEAGDIDRELVDAISANKFMYYYLCDFELVQFFNITQTLESEKNTHHEYGTFFEAIIAGIYLTHGYHQFLKFVVHYITEMSIVSKLHYNDLKVNNLHYVLADLKRDGTKYFLLCNLVRKVFKRKFDIVQPKKSKPGNRRITLNITVPDIGSNTVTNKSYKSQAKTLHEAVEEVARQTLEDIDPIHCEAYYCIH